MARIVACFAPFVILLLVGANVLSAPIGDGDECFDAILVRVDELYAARNDMHNVQQIVEVLELLLDKTEDPYPLLWRLARAYEWLGRYAPASEGVALFAQGVHYAGEAVKVFPQGIEGRYWNALVIGRLGEARGILRSLSAAKDMRRELDVVLEIDPDHAGATYALGVLLHRVPGWPLSFGDRNRALKLMTRATELAPDNTTYRLGLAELLLDLGRQEEALVLLDDVISMPLTPDEQVESAEDKERAADLLARL